MDSSIFHAPTMRVLVCLNLHTLLCNHSSSVLRRMWAQQQSSIFQKIEVLPRESTARYFHATTMRVLVRLNLRTSLGYYVPFLRRTSDQSMSVFTNTALRPLRSYARRDPNLYCEKKWALVPTTCLVWGTFVFREWPAVSRATLAYRCFFWTCLGVDIVASLLSQYHFIDIDISSCYVSSTHIHYRLHEPHERTSSCTSCGTTTSAWDKTANTDGNIALDTVADWFEYCTQSVSGWVILTGWHTHLQSNLRLRPLSSLRNVEFNHLIRRSKIIHLQSLIHEIIFSLVTSSIFTGTPPFFYASIDYSDGKIIIEDHSPTLFDHWQCVHFPPAFHSV